MDWPAVMQCNSPVNSQPFGHTCATDIHEAVAFLLLTLCVFNFSTRINVTEKASFDVDNITDTPRHLIPLARVFST